MDKSDTGLPWFLAKDSQYTYIRDDVPYLVLDWETTNTEYGNPINPVNRLVLGCWLLVYPDGRQVEKYIFGDEYDFAPLLGDIAYVNENKGFIIAHNLKFELQWLKRCGLDLRSTLGFDTMLGQWVLDGNRNPDRRSLDSLSARYALGRKGELVSALMDAGVCPSNIRREWLLKYCWQDIHLTHALFKQEVKLLRERNQLHLAHVRNLTCSALADMEYEGMMLDPDAVNEEYAKAKAAWEEAQAKLYTMTGGINLNSPKQVGTFLFETLGFPIPTDFKGKPMVTKAGQPSTDAAAMAALKAVTEEQEQFLAAYEVFNKLDTLLSKNLIFFKGIIDEYDGKFHGNFNQGTVGTHRLSSSGRQLWFEFIQELKGAQLQNLPREYKRLFWAGGGDYDVGEADGAQLEFRVATELGNDPVGMEMICGAGDVHTDTAIVFVDWNASHPRQPHPNFIGKDYKSGRQPAKAQTFKPLYGGKGSHPAEVEYCEFFKHKYAGIASTQEGWTFKVLNDKKLRTPYGMEFYWPGTEMRRGGYITNTTQIYNYPVQGFATGEIIPIALVHFWHRVKGHRIYPFTTIHDSIVSRVHKEEHENFKRLSKQAFTEDVYRFLREVYDYEFKVPLGMGLKLARNWGVSKTEYTWNVWPDGTETYTLKE
jgi:DNA polymerase I-like protein with 3'-5' exonuclease and polymerase domains